MFELFQNNVLYVKCLVLSLQYDVYDTYKINGVTYKVAVTSLRHSLEISAIRKHIRHFSAYLF